MGGQKKCWRNFGFGFGPARPGPARHGTARRTVP
jgi:hypothetical protein